jgi:hypothetical protein
MNDITFGAFSDELQQIKLAALADLARSGAAKRIQRMGKEKGTKSVNAALARIRGRMDRSTSLSRSNKAMNALLGGQEGKMRALRAK